MSVPKVGYYQKQSRQQRRKGDSKREGLSRGCGPSRSLEGKGGSCVAREGKFEIARSMHLFGLVEDRHCQEKREERKTAAVRSVGQSDNV